MNHAYHCFTYYSYCRDLTGYQSIKEAVVFFWDKAYYYWGISQ